MTLIRRYLSSFFKLAVCLGLLFFIGAHKHIVQRCVAALNYPFLVIEQKIVQPIQHWFLWRRGVGDLQVLTEKLLHERDELRAQIIALEASQDYIKDCQELIDFKKRYNNSSAIIAQVLLRVISDQQQFFFVNAGSDKGVCKDMVAVYHNNLVGRIDEVYRRYCKVILITDKDCCVAATCAQTGARGIYRGCNSQAENVLEYVNHFDALQEDDLVLSLGDGMIFPRGFALGKIKKYRLQNVTYHIIVQPLIDFSSLSFCMLINRE